MLQYLPINVELIKNPVNWAVVVLMVLFAGFALSFITSDMDTGN